jgi:hypothetical protein
VDVFVWYDARMRDFILLFLHLIVTATRAMRPGGVRSVIAESVLLKHQLLILNRSRWRAPNLQVSDRLVAGSVLIVHQTDTPYPYSRHGEAFNIVELPSCAGSAEVSVAVFA